MIYYVMPEGDCLIPFFFVTYSLRIWIYTLPVPGVLPVLILVLLELSL